MKPTTAQRAVFTDRYLKSLKSAAPGKRVTHWDTAKPSFGCRVTDRGVVSFFVMRRMPGKPQPVRVVLGRYPDISLARARVLATEALGDLVAGVHPREREREERLAEARRTADTFAGLADRYLRHRASERRTAREIGRIVRRYLLVRWGSRPVTDIKRADVREMVEDVREQSGRHAARQALTYASAILGYGAALEYGGLEQNPCRMVKAGDLLGKFKPRQRILTNSELAQVWEAATDYPAGPFIRMLILTGARRREVARMTWDEVDLDTGLWTLAGPRTKPEEPDEKPLPGMAVDLLKSLPRFTAGPYVFTSSAGLRPIQAFNAYKCEIAERVPGLGDWRFHDLRRTTRTGLGTIGVSPFIAELVIGHQLKGVHPVYDLYRYRAEKADALERWASKVRDLTEPPPANVLPLRAVST
jgi:integrase